MNARDRPTYRMSRAAILRRCRKGLSRLARGSRRSCLDRARTTWGNCSSSFIITEEGSIYAGNAREQGDSDKISSLDYSYNAEIKEFAPELRERIVLFEGGKLKFVSKASQFHVKDGDSLEGEGEEEDFDKIWNFLGHSTHCCSRCKNHEWPFERKESEFKSYALQFE